MGSSALDPRELSKLKWRCRRGLLENDLFVERFFADHETTITQDEARGLSELMELSDNDLLDLLLARKEPDGELLSEQAVHVLGLMRKAPLVPRSQAQAGDKLALF